MPWRLTDGSVRLQALVQVAFFCLLLPAQVLAIPSAVVLLGPSGAGKSETGNTLLGEIRFNVSAGLESETVVPQAEAVTFGGRDWQVVDTPGYFDTTRSADELEDALSQFAGALSGRVAALAFVVPYGRFGDAHLRGWRLLRGAFGPKAINHTALVFSSCGNRTEEELQAETARLCAKEPPPTLCGVLQELGALSGEAPPRIAAFGALAPERRARDRERLFALAAQMEAASGGAGYDPAEFLRARRRRKALARRAALLADEEERRVIDLMLSNVEAGMLTDEELQRRLEQAEGLGSTERVAVDFEDRSLGPFQQVGSGWRQPMAVPYASMRGFVSAGGGASGGRFFMHTGTDSGVHVRHGDRRMGEFRTEPFRLGSGDVEWEATGSGGYFAVCPVDPSLGSCLERRLVRQSTVLVQDAFGQDELAGFVGFFVYFRLVDDRPSGWGFVALDNLVYPVLPDGVTAPTTEAPGSNEAAAATTTTLQETAPSTPPVQSAATTIAPPVVMSTTLAPTPTTSVEVAPTTTTAHDSSLSAASTPTEAPATAAPPAAEAAATTPTPQEAVSAPVAPPAADDGSGAPAATTAPPTAEAAATTTTAPPEPASAPAAPPAADGGGVVSDPSANAS